MSNHINAVHGYQPEEFLRGNRLRFNEAKGEYERVPRIEETIGIPRAGIFGHCEAQNRAQFMKN